MAQVVDGTAGTAGPQWLRLDEAAACLKLSPRAARAAARRGELPAVKLGREWRIAVAVLQAGTFGRPATGEGNAR